MVALDRSYKKNTIWDCVYNSNLNLHQNMCNHRLSATEESKKDQIVFREYFREQ